jgi:hemolysin-activating ACP:hemolysin acyltransferase
MLMNEPDGTGRFIEASLRRGPDNLSQNNRAVMSQSIALAQIVMMMLRSPNYRHYSLSDLEWLVLPPLMLGQIAMAGTRPDPNDADLPLAVMFWATVSPEVDMRISSNLSAPIRLRPDEWRSGEILWLADMLGDMSAGHSLIKNVLTTTLAGRTLRVRSLGSDGKPALRELGTSSFSTVAVPGTGSCSHAASSSIGMVCPACVLTGCSGRCRSGKAGQGEQLNVGQP